MSSSVGRALFWLSTAASCVAGAAIQRRAVIDHDAVVGFNETVPQNELGGLYLKYKPWLKVVNGCVPFPAVDAEGNTSGGLKPSGGSSSGCDSSVGQVYVRSENYDDYLALMYSWYFPKDEPSTGLGHRHDWECIVVWLENANTSDVSVAGVAASAHGDFSTSTDANFNGTRVWIKYYSIWPLDHQLGFADVQGGEQPLIAYENLTDAAREALETTDFGAANVPFKDANFESNLEEASL